MLLTKQSYFHQHILKTRTNMLHCGNVTIATSSLGEGRFSALLQCYGHTFVSVVLCRLKCDDVPS